VSEQSRAFWVHLEAFNRNPPSEDQMARIATDGNSYRWCDQARYELMKVHGGLK